tara:strand:- start:3146 stop:3601 length:456 start_codon:yes stop_codon:yes gene_type:complete
MVVLSSGVNKVLYFSRKLIQYSIFLYVAVSPIYAHHSTTYFDLELEIVHEDVIVIRFEVANPHGILTYGVTDSRGQLVLWDAELPSANFMRRNGVTNSLMKEGDRLTAVYGQPGIPGKTKEHLIRLSRVVFQNGDIAIFTPISVTYESSSQ